MKKLSSIIVIGSLLLSGVAVAQELDRDRDRLTDGVAAGQSGVPNRYMDNQQIQDCVGEYRVVMDGFMQELQQLRERLDAASNADKVAIQEQIREQLITHLGEQREFRKEVRKIVRQLRKDRVANAPGKGG